MSVWFTLEKAKPKKILKSAFKPIKPFLYPVYIVIFGQNLNAWAQQEDPFLSLLKKITCILMLQPLWMPLKVTKLI